MQTVEMSGRHSICVYGTTVKKKAMYSAIRFSETTGFQQTEEHKTVTSLVNASHDDVIWVYRLELRMHF
jgi:hypothetical protein